MMAGVNVNAANRETSIPMDSGRPMVWKRVSRENVMQKVAPAMVSPEPRTT